MNIRTVTKNLTALDIAAPQALLDVDATRNAITANVFDTPAVHFETALLAGEITAANAADRIRDAARQLLEHEKATELSRLAQPALATLERRALIVSADGLVEQMRPHFDTAIAHLSTFVDTFGTDPAAEDVVAADNGSDHWKLRTAALATLDHIERVCRELRTVNYFEHPDAAVYLTAVRDADHLAQAVTAWHRGAFVELIAQRFELRLNNAEEARAISDNVRTAEQQARVAAQTEKDAEVERRKAESRRLEEQTAGQRKAMAKRYGFR